MNRKKFITETVEVLLPALRPCSRSDRACNGAAAACRCALLVLLALGLLGGIGHAQNALEIKPDGDVSIAKGLSVAGNVSIGTKATGWPLTIQGSGVNSDWLLFADSTGKGRYHINFAGEGFNFVETGIKDYRLFIQAGTGNVGIGKSPDANAKLDVDGAVMAKTLSVTGNVGIGKSPDANAKLDVDGGIMAKTLSLSDNANVTGILVGNNSLIGRKANAFLRFDGTNVVLNAAESGNLYLGFDQGQEIRFGVAGTQMILKPNGDLFVAGTVRYRWGSQWKELYQERDDWAGSRNTSAPSDRRLKTDLHPIPSALEKVSQLRGVTFHWNEQGLQYLTRDIETTLSAGPGASDEDNRKVWQAERDKQYKELSKTNVGVVAQDVEAVLPQAVTTDASGYKLVNYPELIPLVIEALKEEDKISQEQARTIASQQTEIQRLTIANQAAQQQLSDLQEVKQKLGRLEAAVNQFMASGSSADRDSLPSAGERSAVAHPSGSE